MAFEKGDFLWECAGLSDFTPKGEFVREHTGLPCWVLENDLIVEAYRFVRLNFQIGNVY